MKGKKLAALLLSMSLFASIVAGCGNSGKGTDNTGTGTGTGNNATTTTATDEVATIKWVTVGNGMPDNYDAWKKNINSYLGEKIGVNIEMEVIPWGDWDSRRSVLVNTGGDYDILFTNSGTYTSDVKLGAFMDISDLVKTSASDLYNYIPSDYWDASKVDGKIYAVPTYKDSSATQYFVWDEKLAKDNGIEVEKITSLKDLVEPMKKLKEATGSAPFILSSSGLEAIFGMSYDSMGSGLPAIGVKYDDETRTVVNVFEQKDIMDQLSVLHEMYKAGIINADAPTLAETPSYRPFFVAQGWSLAAKTTWGPNMGVDAVAIQWGDTIVSNETVQGSLNCISANTKYPEKCLEFLQMVNLDTYVRDAFYYGLENDNFKYTEDKKIERLNTDWSMAGYTQGTFFTVSQLATDEFNQWDEVKELNAKAKGSVLLGFSFDTSSVADELSNCIEIYRRYKSELLTGMAEPVSTVKEMIKEMNDAGLQKIIEEAQNQINASF